MTKLWPRTVELGLAAWLLLSPLVFGHPERWGITVADAAGGLLLVLFVVLSLRPGLRHLHLGTLGVAVGLIAWGWAHFARPGPPGAQNLILVGLFLALLGVIPSRATAPPEPWRD